MVKVGVVIPARNEEAVLGETLQHLVNQTRQPDKIIVVDDGSTDKTAGIARRFKASVVHLADTGNKVGTPALAATTNKGFEALNHVGKFDYVIVLGADHPLPPTYVEKMVARMEANKKLVMASARILGEASHAETPNPSGRIYRFKFLREIGFFRLNYGWEDYPMYKALMMGYGVKFFSDIASTQQRPLRVSARKMFFWGKGMKALGYHPLYVLGRCAFWFQKSPKGAVSMLGGYLSTDVKAYSDLKGFLGKWQKAIIGKRIREIPRFLRK